MREPDTSDTRVTRTTWVQHEWEWVQHERYTNYTKAPRVKNLDFDNDKSENIFPHPYISYVKNEKLQEVEQL